MISWKWFPNHLINIIWLLIYEQQRGPVQLVYHNLLQFHHADRTFVSINLSHTSMSETLDTYLTLVSGHLLATPSSAFVRPHNTNPIVSVTNSTHALPWWMCGRPFVRDQRERQNVSTHLWPHKLAAPPAAHVQCIESRRTLIINMSQTGAVCTNTTPRYAYFPSSPSSTLPHTHNTQWPYECVPSSERFVRPTQTTSTIDDERGARRLHTYRLLYTLVRYVRALPRRTLRRQQRGDAKQTTSAHRRSCTEHSIYLHRPHVGTVTFALQSFWGTGRAHFPGICVRDSISCTRSARLRVLCKIRMEFVSTRKVSHVNIGVWTTPIPSPIRIRD